MCVVFMCIDTYIMQVDILEYVGMYICMYVGRHVEINIFIYTHINVGMDACMCVHVSYMYVYL